MDFVANTAGSSSDLADDVEKKLSVNDEDNDDSNDEEEGDNGDSSGKKKKKKKKRSKKKAMDIPFIAPLSRVLGGSTNYYVKYGQTNPPTIPVSRIML
mgnify:CR=1 FL=1